MFAAYEDYLIGRRKGACFFNTDTGAPTEGQALMVIRYAVECLLKWDPEAAVNKFDSYMVGKLKLERFVAALKFPVEVPAGDTSYILSLLYPHLIYYDQQSLAERMYISVIRDGSQFPRDYFTGVKGFRRYCACLRYVLTEYKNFGSVQEIYGFCCSPEGRRFLSAHRLKSPATQVGISMADAVYEVTRSLPGSALYHSYYCFEKELETENKGGKDVDG